MPAVLPRRALCRGFCAQKSCRSTQYTGRLRAALASWPLHLACSARTSRRALRDCQHPVAALFPPLIPAFPPYPCLCRRQGRAADARQRVPVHQHTRPQLHLGSAPAPPAGGLAWVGVSCDGISASIQQLVNSAKSAHLNIGMGRHPRTWGLGRSGCAAQLVRRKGGPRLFSAAGRRLAATLLPR